MIRGRFAREDVRAGWIDARRTTRPRIRTGWRVGATDYAIGYAAGVLVGKWRA